MQNSLSVSEKQICHCGAPAEFGYKVQGAMQWFCETHRISQNYADARLPKTAGIVAVAKAPVPLTGALRFYNLPEGAMPSREIWVGIGKQLVSAEKNIQWVLGEWWIKGEREYGDGRALAEEIGIGYGTIRNYASVVRAFDCHDRRDNLSFGHHQEVAALPPPKRDEWLQRAERDDLSVMQLRQAVKVSTAKDRRAQREQDFAEGTAAASKALGKKLYGVIYADPPWHYDSPPMGDLARHAGQHYPTMKLENIKALEIPAASDCTLFLWACIPLLPQALEVLAAWGFTYKTASIWVKDKAGVGYWIRGVAELLLIATRGTVPSPALGDQFPGVIEAPRRRHSEKPDIFAEHIVRLFPNAPKLEMFARESRKGWDVWGNEVSEPQQRRVRR